jgi:hypothetical protein
MMKTAVIGMFTLLILAPMPSRAFETWDRVCIHDGAPLYSNPERNAEEDDPTAKRWTLAKWLETSEIGTELVRLENGEVWWVERHDFYPVYRVFGAEPVEVLGAYYKDPPEDDTKPDGKPDTSKVIGHLDPGELVAGNPLEQAFNNTMPIENETGLTGYVDRESLELVGEPGWGMGHPDSLELYPAEE